MFRKLAFVMYPAKDVARARSFYEETLGLSPGMVGGHGDKHWIEYDLPEGGCFAITNATPNEPSHSAGGMVAFEVEDIGRLVAELKAKGVRFRADDIHGPACRMAICLDSEGNAFMLHQLNRKG